MEELKNGKQIRIKYDELVHDYVEIDSGWKEELWRYDSQLDLFKCYYPISTYEKTSTQFMQKIQQKDSWMKPR